MRTHFVPQGLAVNGDFDILRCELLVEVGLALVNGDLRFQLEFGGPVGVQAEVSDLLGALVEVCGGTLFLLSGVRKFDCLPANMRRRLFSAVVSSEAGLDFECRLELGSAVTRIGWHLSVVLKFGNDDLLRWIAKQVVLMTILAVAHNSSEVIFGIFI